MFVPFKSGAEISVRTVSGSETSTVSLGVGSGLSLYENLFPVVTKSTRGGASDGESAPIVYSYSGSILKITANRYHYGNFSVTAYILDIQ